MDFYKGIAIAVAHLVLSYGCVVWVKGRPRQYLFFLLNVVAFAAQYVDPVSHLAFQRLPLYLAVISGYFWLVKFVRNKPERWQSLVQFLPLALLVGTYLLRTNEVPMSWRPKYRTHLPFLGFSFMAFRMTLFSLEVKGRRISDVTFVEYGSYLLFAPAIWVGPITRPSTFISGLRAPFTLVSRDTKPLIRILLGGLKYYFLGPVVGRLSPLGILAGGFSLTPFQLFVAGAGGLLQLYLNFSGLCDIAIGSANFLGLPFSENFRSPFTATSISQFWQRWHISLTGFLREVAFLPLCRLFQVLFGSKNSRLVTYCGVMATFVLIGVWHGFKWHYLWFGVLHGAAVLLQSEFSFWGKRLLPPGKWTELQRSRWFIMGSWALTFLFVSVMQLVFSLEIWMLEFAIKGMR